MADATGDWKRELEIMKILVDIQTVYTVLDRVWSYLTM